MAATDAKPIPIKNQAHRHTFPLYDATGDLVTGAGSLDTEISKDAATFTDCTNEAVEIATSSGMYYIDLTATEMNADTVALIVKSTLAKTLPIVLCPQESGDIPVQVEGMDAGVVTAAAIATDAIGSDELAASAATEIANRVAALGLYEENAVHLDTNASNTNTVVGVDGVSMNPVSTLAAALTLIGSTGLDRIKVYAGSTVAPSGAITDSVEFFGRDWKWSPINNYAYGGSRIVGADCTVADFDSGTDVDYKDCTIGNAVSLDAGLIGSTGGVFEDCEFRYYWSTPGAGTYDFIRCRFTNSSTLNTTASATTTRMEECIGDLTIQSFASSTWTVIGSSIGVFTFSTPSSGTATFIGLGAEPVQSGGSMTLDLSGYAYDVGDQLTSLSDQISNIAAVGAAVNATADSYTLTTGTQTANTYADTAPLDGVRHTHTDTAGALELYYEFLIGAGVPTGMTVTGYLQGNNDSLEVYAYDWVAASWVQVGDMAGQVAATNSVFTYSLFTAMVGTGANRGKVRIRFYAASGLTTATLAIDQVFVSYAQALGVYDNGAVWIDTSLSNTNTVVGVDGTSTNPVSTIAAALTLSAATNLKRLVLAPGSSITLAATLNGYRVYGHGATVALGGQDVTDTHFEGVKISGVCTGTTPHFHECEFNGSTTVPACLMTECSWGGTLILNSTGDYYFADCFSRVAGAGAPTLDMGAGVGAQNINIRRYSGGLTVDNIAAGDVMSFGGSDIGTLTLNGADGTVDVRGTGKPVIDNRTGTPTLTQTGHVNAANIDTELTSTHGAGSWSSSGLAGSETVTLHTQTSGGAAIPNVRLTIRDSGDTATLGVVETNTSGDASGINLNAGTYKIRGTRAGSTFATQTIVVTGDATFNITGTNVTTSTPSAPSTCVVYGTVVEEDGTPLQGAMVTAKVKNQPDGYFKGGNIVANRNARHNTKTDAAGYFELQLVQEAEVDFEIDQAGINFTKTVPTADSQDVSSW